MNPIYLDTLVALLEVVSATGKLTYDAAKEKTDLVLSQYGVHDLVGDKEFDDPNDDEIKVSSPGKILRRLEKAGWIRRETDRITGEDVIRFPQSTFKLLRVFIEISEGQEVEYDAHLISILNMLSQNEIPKRRAIAFANQEMITLLDDIQGLNQQYASLRPDVEALDHKDIADWTQRFSSSPLKLAYDHLRLRNSPDRWFNEITEVASYLQHNSTKIAEDSLKASAALTFEQPNPARVRPISSEISTQLTFIIHGMRQLINATEDLDRHARDFVNTYSRRINTAIASQSAEKLLLTIDRLFAALRAVPRGRGGGDPLIDDGLSVLLRFHFISPNAAAIRNFNAEKPTPTVETFEDASIAQTSFDESALAYMRKAAQYIGPRMVQEHFLRIFGERTEIAAKELLGETWESALYLIRLIDCCGLPDGFAFEIAWVGDGEHEPVPMVENYFRRVSNVSVRKRPILSTE